MNEEKEKGEKRDNPFSVYAVAFRGKTKRAGIVHAVYGAVPEGVGKQLFRRFFGIYSFDK